MSTPEKIQEKIAMEIYFAKKLRKEIQRVKELQRKNDEKEALILIGEMEAGIIKAQDLDLRQTELTRAFVKNMLKSLEDHKKQEENKEGVQSNAVPAQGNEDGN
ncbi:OLC1v1001544C1 [Oldenlandia corymbosa var. corymbosa]|uniref:OLC1v1001544C1 n=1 Tax=Oldenlandia corymbosa var. corymbosa TaxID=529605 RepID=A0AAV1D8B4_OLDCO|nr:OLC1v1001544C1 [Oldenlandia corymbosa var. corymbosa]